MSEAPWLVPCVALATALAWDRWFGEPALRWHPVAWMGRALEHAGRQLQRRADPDPARADWRTLRAGAAWWCALALAAAGAAWLAQRLVLSLPWFVAAPLLGVLLKPLFAWRMLRDEVGAVEAGLGSSLADGRARLARLVSRDVAVLAPHEVRESAIESLAENLNDSVVAPLFWFALLGLPGAALYRLANTADAMWGYRGLRGGRNWEWAGKFAARADDVLSWVPARIAAVLLCAVAPGQPWRGLAREARRTPSPNSGWPMAAMALALRVRLSKPRVYALNAGAPPPGPEDTLCALRLAGRAVAAAAALACAGLVAVAQVPR